MKIKKRKARVLVRVATVLKSGEGGPGTTWMVKALKHEGIHAASYPSCFVGHSQLWVEKGKVGQARKILGGALP